jgi:phosphate uptake regulator
VSVDNPKGCFVQQERICGSDCVAYNEDTSGTSREISSHPLAHCHLLLNLHRIGKHAVIMAQDVAAIREKVGG